MKYQVGWITSWNQDCWERYLLPHICKWYHSNGRKLKWTKKHLDEGEKESEKAGWELNIQKTKILASDPIISWTTEGEKAEVTDFIFLGSKITVYGDCSHDIKRCLLLGRKAMTNLDSILKSKRHHLANKGLCSQTYVFPVLIYGCESWTIKKTEHWRIDALNCGVGENSWESFGQQGDPTSQS